MNSNHKQAQSFFELGKLYSDRGDFQAAMEPLKMASKLFLEAKEFDFYFKSQNLLLRIYGEMEDYENITLLKETLQDFVIKENIELNSKTYYTLGICACYKGQTKIGFDYFQKSLTIALSKDNKEDICYAINGIANIYMMLGKYSEALKEIYNLQIFFQVLDLNELKLSTQILNGRILSETGKHEQAMEIFWQCYDLLIREKNLYMFIFLLYSMGVTAKQLGDTHLANAYLQLSRRSVDPDNMKWLNKKIDSAIKELGITLPSDYDLIIDFGSNSITEKNKGSIDLKNQFLLLDLLKLFMSHPGQIFSKEELVKRIWKQEYKPSIHDNKVYVTIKRLRRLIEPDFDKPKYIFRAKNGYYLNKKSRVYLNHMNREVEL